MPENPYGSPFWPADSPAAALPNAVVACFTLNRQSIDGVRGVLSSIRDFRSQSMDAIEFFPLATRIENAEQQRLEIARKYARKALSDYLPKNAQDYPRVYWDKMEISYRPAYAFEEILAAFGDATGASGAADTMLSQVEAMAQRITGDKDLRMPEILESDRARVLAKYALEGRAGRADFDRGTGYCLGESQNRKGGARRI
jgi:hypothetical protein